MRGSLKEAGFAYDLDEGFWIALLDAFKLSSTMHQTSLRRVKSTDVLRASRRVGTIEVGLQALSDCFTFDILAALDKLPRTVIPHALRVDSLND